MIDPAHKNWLFNCIRFATFFVFIGRAYQFYFFGAPLRAILWDESLLSPVVESLFNMDWNCYATSETVNFWIAGITTIFSFVLFIAAFVAFFWKYILNIRFKNTIICAAIIIMAILGVCMVKDKNYDILQFFELSLQLAAPILLLFYDRWKDANRKKVVLFIKIATALTFVPHGIFAIGLIYVPGHFIDMTIKILGFSELQARHFLMIFGVLDILASIGLFIPKVTKFALWYIIIWGLLTASARIVAGFNMDFIYYSIHNHLYLSVYRIVHGLLPLGLLLYYYSNVHQIKSNGS